MVPILTNVIDTAASSRAAAGPLGRRPGPTAEVPPQRGLANGRFVNVGQGVGTGAQNFARREIRGSNHG